MVYYSGSLTPCIDPSGRVDCFCVVFGFVFVSLFVVTAIADIKQGNSEATAWGCDLTFDYIKINADYRS